MTHQYDTDEISFPDGDKTVIVKNEFGRTRDSQTATAAGVSLTADVKQRRVTRGNGDSPCRQVFHAAPRASETNDKTQTQFTEQRTEERWEAKLEKTEVKPEKGITQEDENTGTEIEEVETEGVQRDREETVGAKVREECKLVGKSKEQKRETTGKGSNKGETEEAHVVKDDSRETALGDQRSPVREVSHEHKSALKIIINTITPDTKEEPDCSTTCEEVDDEDAPA